MSETATPVTLVICPDLIFSTKIFATARAAGVAVRGVRTVEALREQLAAGGVKRVIIDLNATGIDAIEAIGVVRAAAVSPEVVAFLSHVQAELAAAAREAGADVVLARSAFSAKLWEILSGAPRG